MSTITGKKMGVIFISQAGHPALSADCEMKGRIIRITGGARIP